MFMEEIFFILYPVYMLPSAAGVGFHVSRETNIIEDIVPVERVNEVTERFIRCVVRQLVGGEQHGAGYIYTGFFREGIVEELIVG